MTTARVFRGFRFPAEVILWAVRWYLQFPISYRDLEAMPADRGVAVDHTTMYRWVQRFAPELEKRTTGVRAHRMIQDTGRAQCAHIADPCKVAGRRLYLILRPPKSPRILIAPCFYFRRTDTRC